MVIILRRLLLPDWLADKIDDMTTTEKRVPVLIYNAAFERLQRKFTPAQSKLLATMMVAQSKVESNVYTSNVYIQNKNAFGYKYYAGSIYQVAKGTNAPASEGDSYGAYASVEDSAREVADWLCRRADYFKNVVTVADYATALKANQYYGETAAAYARDMNTYYTNNIV